MTQRRLSAKSLLSRFSGTRTVDIDSKADVERRCTTFYTMRGLSKVANRDIDSESSQML